MDDPLILQAKEAQPSVLERFHPSSGYRNSGERVVAGQRLMQASSDIFLGWQRTTGIDGKRRDFYVRQLRDGKGSFDLSRTVPVGLAAYGRICGWTLARAHARAPLPHRGTLCETAFNTALTGDEALDNSPLTRAYAGFSPLTVWCSSP